MVSDACKLVDDEKPVQAEADAQEDTSQARAPKDTAAAVNALYGDAKLGEDDISVDSDTD